MLKNFIYFLILCILFRVVKINSYTLTKLQRSTGSDHRVNKDGQSTEASQNLENCIEVVGVSGVLKKCHTCPKNIKCVPHIQCPVHVRLQPNERPQTCDLPTGEPGFCCLTGQNHTVSSNINKQRTFLHLIKLKRTLFEEARAKYTDLLHNQDYHHNSHLVQRGQPEFMHNIMFQSSPHDRMKSIQLSNSAMEQVFASQILKDKQHIPSEEFELNTIQLDFTSSPFEQNCLRLPICRNLKSPYRKVDGTCNNPLPFRSHWGSAGQPMERLLPPAYEDGIWMPRRHSIDGSQLMGAREISRQLLFDTDRPHPKYNLLVMQFGQFIAHDVTQSSSITFENGEAIQCCSSDGSHILPRNERHFACMPIEIEPEDEFYRIYNQRCMNFVRLALAPNSDCRIGYGKQLSKVTHFIDGSHIYGSSEATQNELREFRGGRLRMFHDFGRDLLPLAEDRNSCENLEVGGVCFKAGDTRVNQIISLVALHTIFAREHNRIANFLAHINPHFSEEQLFQETRRIIIAEIQHITYNEWLPLIIGQAAMRRFHLIPRHHGYATDYDPKVNPAVTNEFTGAAFRFGHSTVSGKYRMHKDNTIKETIEIPDVMFNPSRLRKRTFLDEFMRGLMEQPMQKVDNSISDGLSKFLFRGGNPFGLDLAALNIQRGRDEGLRCYNDYLEVTGRRRIRGFEEFGPVIGPKLSQVYKHPNDIDLWIGGLMESVISPDAAVGKTFVEIIADQFSRLRHGDRYFYEYAPEINPGHFTHDQLGEIRKVTMARIICDNVDHYTLHEISPAAFIINNFHGNHLIRCDSLAIPAMNLEAWRE